MSLRITRSDGDTSASETSWSPIRRSGSFLEFIGGQMMKVTTGAKNFELRRGVSYGIIAKVLDLIGREHGGKRILGQRPYSGNDAHSWRGS